jgi:hypothetical protein
MPIGRHQCNKLHAIICLFHHEVDHCFGMLLQMMLNSKDLSFVGYTYKNFEAVKGLHQFAGL